MKRRPPSRLAALLCVCATAAAPAAQRCSHDVLRVRGVPVSAVYCLAAAGPVENGELPVTVDESFSSPRGGFSRRRQLRFIAGEDSSRVIETVQLSRVGLEGTLHTTLVLRGGAVRLEGAVLTPGALTIR